MEATCSSEITSDFKWISLLYIPEDTAVHSHCCEATNLIFGTNGSSAQVRGNDCDLIYSIIEVRGLGYTTRVVV
jgi:hypothetical protein